MFGKGPSGMKEYNTLFTMYSLKWSQSLLTLFNNTLDYKKAI